MGRRKRRNKNKNKGKTKKGKSNMTYQAGTYTSSGLSGLFPLDDSVLPWDFEKMEEILNAPEDFFDKMGDKYNLPKPTIVDTTYGPLWHFDRGGDVLGVAHMDSVAAKYNHFSVVEFGPGEHRVFNAHLDDRLGAYIALSLLPDLGLGHDILLTTGEESMMSTAEFFESPKDYNWIFQFDRSGKDAVLYDYESAEARQLLQSYGWAVGKGSYTDICVLEHLGCIAMNLGVGYYDYHSKFAYAELPETTASIMAFLELYADNKDIHMPYNGYQGFYYRGYNPVYEWEKDSRTWSRNSKVPLNTSPHATGARTTSDSWEGGRNSDELDYLDDDWRDSMDGGIKNMKTSMPYLCPECKEYREIPEVIDEGMCDKCYDITYGSNSFGSQTNSEEPENCAYCDTLTTRRAVVGGSWWPLCTICTQQFTNEITGEILIDESEMEDDLDVDTGGDYDTI